MKKLIVPAILVLSGCSPKTAGEDLDRHRNDLSIPASWENEHTIVWHPERKLKIGEFRGDTLNRPNQAMTSASIHYLTEENRLSGKIRVHAACVFNCRGSYFKRSSLDSLVLAHEQAHFDICELYRRKLLSRFEQEIKSHKDLKQKHQMIFEEVMREYRNKQNAYDEEVYRNNHYQAQRKWSDWVAVELERMEKYAARVLELNR